MSWGTHLVQIAWFARCRLRCRLRCWLSSGWELGQEALNCWCFAQQRAQSLVLVSQGKGEQWSDNILDNKGQDDWYRQPGEWTMGDTEGAEDSGGRLRSELTWTGYKSPEIPMLRILLGGTSSGCFCVTALWINCSVEWDILDSALDTSSNYESEGSKDSSKVLSVSLEPFVPLCHLLWRGFSPSSDTLLWWERDCQSLMNGQSEKSP